MIYKGKISFKEMLGILGGEKSGKKPRYAYVFPNTTKPLTAEEEQALASVVVSLAKRIEKY